MAQTIYMAMNADRSSDNIIQMLKDVIPAGAKRGFDVAVDAVMDVKIYNPFAAEPNILITGEGAVIKESSTNVTTLTIPTDVADKAYYVVCRYTHGVTAAATYHAALLGTQLATDTPLTCVYVPGGTAALTSEMLYPYPRNHVNGRAVHGLQLYNSTPISGVYGDYIRKTHPLQIGSVVESAGITFPPGALNTVSASFHMPVGFKTTVQSFNDPTVSLDHLARAYFRCSNIGAAGNVAVVFTWVIFSEALGYSATSVSKRTAFNPALNQVDCVECDMPAALIAAWSGTHNVAYRLDVARIGTLGADTYGGTLIPGEVVLQYPINRLGAAYTT